MFLFIAFLLPLFGTYGDKGSVIQVIGMLFFILAGAIDIVRARLNKRLFKLDGATTLICFLLPIFSCFALLLNQQPELIPQTLAFMFCALAARALILVNGVIKTIRLIIYVSITMTALTFFIEYEKLVQSLHFAIGEDGGRLRFSPFDNHPNLTGHIYGFSFLACVVYLYWHKDKRDKFWFVSMLTSVACLFILGGTSSRGTFVGTFVALGAVYAVHLLHGVNLGRKVINIVVVGVLFFFMILLTNPEKIADYFSELFELNSTYRGFDSGLTGRSDNWTVIFAMSLESFDGVVFGHGIRSWITSVYGIATDSSYINSLWESGAFLTFAIIMLMVTKIYHAGMASRTFVSDFYLAIFVFAAVESIVARYLLGIGNPASLMILVVLLTPKYMFYSRGKLNETIFYRTIRGCIIKKTYLETKQNSVR